MPFLYTWVTLIVVLVLDRLSKWVVQSNMTLGESRVVIPGFFHLTYILNPGAAFGMLQGQKWVLVTVSVIVLAALFYFQRKVPHGQRLMRVSMGLIGGGALGNLWDRLLTGKVIDFLDFKVWSYIFNIADSMIVIGGILLIILLMRMKEDTNDESLF
ncbi:MULTISPECIES: signal peptidase II [Dehalobacter]|uniref:Lipoprotein signal peptidase n=2 Tax=Dehalobacter restrictus TaxID=55583 RepID=A0A857DKZ7_9FIRM|nr:MULTISPECIES: signal peptidase II [Dehalobacter]AHF10548.1 peptidase A8 [Dehalobacter restrictus DSM 9455]MCG1026292.1 signal peptidase II [Dehalobacter sp.]MDJ0306698.1 signal peptidase II [Dehalobacter sp.]QHA01172.1 signal peptidase II [Dehalobacter restrictus]